MLRTSRGHPTGYGGRPTDISWDYRWCPMGIASYMMRIPWGIRQVYHEHPMGISWASHGASHGHPVHISWGHAMSRASCGPPMGYPGGIPWDNPRVSRVHLMGIPLDIPWDAMGILWASHGISRGHPMGQPTGIPCASHGHPIGHPMGCHGHPLGFGGHPMGQLTGIPWASYEIP